MLWIISDRQHCKSSTDIFPYNIFPASSVNIIQDQSKLVKTRKSTMGFSLTDLTHISPTDPLMSLSGTRSKSGSHVVFCCLRPLVSGILNPLPIFCCSYSLSILRSAGKVSADYLHFGFVWCVLMIWFKLCVWSKNITEATSCPSPCLESDVGCLSVPKLERWLPSLG